MTHSRLFLFLACAGSLLLMGCPTDGRRSTYDYLRSPVTFRIDPVAENHPFCNDIGTLFASVEECRQTKKYRLLWERPEDTVRFSEYRIYVDTTPPGSPGLPWQDIRKQRSLSSFFMTGSASPSDSIIFILSDEASGPAEVTRGAGRIFALDTTGRVDSLGKLLFAITTSYGESGAEGQPRYTWVITNDRFAPYPMQPAFTPKARSLEVAWSRPRDPTSFFEPTADSGIIRGYVLKVVHGGVLTNTDSFPRPQIVYRAGGVDRTAEVTADAFTTFRGAKGWRFRLPDSLRVFNRDSADARDSLKMTLNGLSPLDTLDISLWAADLEGNTTDTLSFTRVLLTDTTQPVTPLLRLLPGSVTHNGFAYAFTASRDRVESGGGLVPAASPNANILEYRLSRKRIGGAAGGAAQTDSVVEIKAERRNDTLFTDTVRYLPPGAVYRIYVQAVDSTGHLSERDSLDVSTLASAFPDAESTATCPPGLIAVPGGSFVLGDTTANGHDADEEPQRAGSLRYIKSFCIEPYEHRADNKFQTRVTWQQAYDICRNLTGTPSDSAHLCTEAEWERACEGIESPPLTYGIQSERQNPGGVRFSCNIGTGDSAMATSLALRDPTCLSRDGAFDMSGNLSEWVLDRYSYSAYSRAGDTLRPGVPLTTPAQSDTLGFRGTHYLNPNTAPSALLRTARCSNRDYAKQARPRPYPGCVDADNPQIVVLYTGKPPRCLSLPDSLIGKPLSNVSTSQDSTKLLILVEGVTKPIVFTLPADSLYKGRALSAAFTPRALAVVTFENSETHETVVDTLDAVEMRNASEERLTAIFSREAAPPWSVRRVNGQYEIRYYYAYAATYATRARANYSNAVMGFRCCSLPRP